MRVRCLEMNTEAFHFQIDPPTALDRVTFESWIRFDPTTKAHFFTWESGPTGARRRGALRLIDGSLWLLAAGDAMPLTKELLQERLAVWDRRWHHLAVALSGSDARIHLDGSLLSDRTSDVLAA